MAEATITPDENGNLTLELAVEVPREIVVATPVQTGQVEGVREGGTAR